MTTPCFVNLSNHPLGEWSADQRAAARALAPLVVDVPFPAVPSDADADALGGLVASALDAVPRGACAAMVQGEPVVSVMLVAALQARGVRCVVATTDRCVETLEDGRQVRRFAFKGWRGWPPLTMG